MTDGRSWLGHIGVRVAIATVAVAIGAVGVLSVLTLLAARGDVSQLTRLEEDQVVSAIDTAVRHAYRTGGSWADADLRAATALAARNSAKLALLDASGRAVALPAVKAPAPPRVLVGPVRSRHVTIGTRTVGTIVVHFYRSDPPTAAAHLRDVLVRTVLVGAGVAVLLALGVAVGLSRRITLPVVRLTRALRARGRGDRAARVGPLRTSGELAELARAYDEMADTIDHEEALRRAVVTDVAHELRTPLAILQASTESLADGTIPLTPDAMASLNDEVLRLGRIIEDLDTLATAEAALLPMALRPADLAQIAQETIEVLEPSYRAMGVAIVSDLSPAVALVDPDRAGQIVANLLTNARKFTDPGGRVTVSVREEPGGVTLRVVDTGTGIPPDELPHVFERFWRGRQAGRVAGSGIGLALVSALVEAHGGTVEVDSETDRGTRFTVRFLPVVDGVAARSLL